MGHSLSQVLQRGSEKAGDLIEDPCGINPLRRGPSSRLVDFLKPKCSLLSSGALKRLFHGKNEVLLRIANLIEASCLERGFCSIVSLLNKGRGLERFFSGNIVRDKAGTEFAPYPIQTHRVCVRRGPASRDNGARVARHSKGEHDETQRETGTGSNWRPRTNPAGIGLHYRQPACNYRHHYLQPVYRGEGW